MLKLALRHLLNNGITFSIKWLKHGTHSLKTGVSGKLKKKTSGFFNPIRILQPKSLKMAMDQWLMCCAPTFCLKMHRHDYRFWMTRKNHFWQYSITCSIGNQVKQ